MTISGCFLRHGKSRQSPQRHLLRVFRHLLSGPWEQVDLCSIASTVASSVASSFVRKTDARLCFRHSRTSRVGNVRASSRAREVTPMPLSPQGLIQLKGSRMVFTLKAKPWKVMPRRTAIPILPNLLLLTQTPRFMGLRSAITPQSAAGADHDFFQGGHIFGHGQPCRMEIDDAIPDKLAGSVECDVATPLHMEDRDPGLLQKALGDGEVLASASAAQSENRRVFQEHDDIRVQDRRVPGGNQLNLQSPGVRVIQRR